MTIIIGVTGKSGSGKSTFASQLSILTQFKHIDMDYQFHLQIDKHIKEITKVLGLKHMPDREEIGNIILNNREKYDNVTAIIYKPTIREVFSLIENYTTVIIEHILLPFMPEIWQICNIKYLVKMPEHDRLSRIIKRDKLTLERTLLREKASPDYDKIVFDYVINNTAMEK